MQRRDAFAPQVGKSGFKTRLQLRRQVDLGHHHQHLRRRVLRQHGGGGAQIDLGFAAAGGSKQQRGTLLAGGFSIKFGDGAYLLGAECY